MTDQVKVGTCDVHEWAGIHVQDTYEDGDGGEFCCNFVEIPGFVHQPSDSGNAFGGCNCACGEPWLDSLGGCMVSPAGPAVPGVSPRVRGGTRRGGLA